MIAYEYPFNESLRTLLRLEHLLNRLAQLVARDGAIDHHYALATLFELLDIAARVELKGELIHELDRQRQQLMAYRGNPAIDEPALEATLARLEQSRTALHALAGKVGQTLMAHEGLMAIRSRMGIPGGSCAFDLPAYHAWQHLDTERRRADLTGWIATLEPLATADQLVLSLLRGAGTVHRAEVRAGQFQMRLPAGRSYQLARLQVDPARGWVPEITGHRLQVAIRLMQPDAEGRLRPLPVDVDLPLILCA